MLKVTSRTSGRALVGLPALTLPHFSHITVLVLSKIDCRTIGLKKVERECNNLGKNSHFLGKVCFVWFWVEKSTAKRKTILNSPPPLLCYPCNSSPYLALGRSEIVFYQLRLNILTHIVKLYDFLE